MKEWVGSKISKLKEELWMQAERVRIYNFGLAKGKGARETPDRMRFQGGGSTADGISRLMSERAASAVTGRTDQDTTRLARVGVGKETCHR